MAGPLERLAPVALGIALGWLAGALCRERPPARIELATPAPSPSPATPSPSPSPSPATPSPSPSAAVAPVASLAQPWPDAPVARLEKGRALFHDRGRTGCTGCHDDRSAGNAPSLMGLGDRYPRFFASREDAADFILRHVRNPEKFPGKTGRAWPVRMFAFRADTLSDEEVGLVADFLLSRTGARPVSGATEPLEGSAGAEAPPSAERGGELADRLKCGSCHSAAKGTSLRGLFDRLRREKGSAAAARQTLAAKLASHPRELGAQDVRDLVEFLKQAR